MSTVHVDIVDELDLSERKGVVTRLTRLARVTGLSDSDPQALKSALTACTSGGFSIGSTLTGYPANLILAERAAKATGDRTVVDVSLGYEIDTQAQNLAGLPFGFVTATLNTNLVQGTSYTDIHGDPVTVTHVYPVTATRFKGLSLDKRTKTNRVPVPGLKPQLELRVNYVKATSHPELIAAEIGGKVNANPWYGATAREWLCTGVTITPVKSDVEPPTFDFGFVFQRNPQTWDEKAVFTDEVTGVAPSGELGEIVEGVGSVTVEIYDECDFESVLEARVYNG